MEDLDIIKLRKILVYKGKQDIADLLMHSRSFVNESTTFGSRWYSRLSVFEIYSPVSKNEKLSTLNDSDKKIIFDSIRQIYPLKDEAPEITKVEFFPDFDLDEIDLVKSESLNNISFNYIKEQIGKCENKIIDQDYEGAITNARNLIESVCLYIIESLSEEEEYTYDGNLIKLYKKVSNIMNMSPSLYSDDNTKQILSGIISSINGISGLRNNFSDAHGGSPSDKQFRIDNSLAILAVNNAKTIAEYLYLTYEKQKD